LPPPQSLSAQEAVPEARGKAVDREPRAAPPVTIVKQQTIWNGSVITFSLTAKMGFLQNPISGTVEVTDKEVTINTDLGMLSKLFSADKFRATVESRVRGLLT